MAQAPVGGDYVSGGLAALLDDIAALAKLTAASLDDIGAAAGKAGTKSLGVVVDDAAVRRRLHRFAGTPDHQEDRHRVDPQQKKGAAAH